MKANRGISESSTTSDNTTEFIEIVRKYDVVYNTHNPDYKNVEVKLKVWSQIADEIGLSIDASKRKWKNLRDSYTKYLRSFRVGTKTSKKYQYWAHAEHMEFLKPYQGPGRNATSNGKANDEEDNECDLSFQMMTKSGSAAALEDDLKMTPPASADVSNQSTCNSTNNGMVGTLDVMPPITAHLNSQAAAAAVAMAAAASGASQLPLSIPTLPIVPLPPQLSNNKPILNPLTNLATTLAAQIFPLPQMASAAKTPLPAPNTSAASSVGCFIIEQLFSNAGATTTATTSDAFKKEFNAPGLGLVTSTATGTMASTKINPPLITKIRRVQPSPQTTAINLSFSSSSASVSSNNNATNNCQPTPAKMRKTSVKAEPQPQQQLDIAAILQASRELDANTLFFLSLARAVHAMPTKCQSLAKMRCMRIVSDIELELDNAINDTSSQQASSSTGPNMDAAAGAGGDMGTEHFVYVMSPSRMEGMIDVSSDEESAVNGNA